MGQLSIAVDAVSLACEERGSGPAVALLHGFPLDHEMWAAQIEGLSPQCRVLAPDLRGFGQSQLTAFDVQVGVPMEKYAADLLATLDTLGVKHPIVLAGFSMGGYAAWQFAVRYPERLRGLVLCDTRAAADGADARAGRLKMAAEVLAAQSPEPATAMLPRLVSPETTKSRPEIAERVRTMIRRQSPQAIAAAQRGMARREDVTARLPAISCPALVMVGAEDAISPPQEMRQIARALPAARFVEIPHAGHMSPMENPAAVTEAMRDFLESLPN
jgi:pimeloyl-ACP methyl ester carboxylesterase